MKRTVCISLAIATTAVTLVAAAIIEPTASAEPVVTVASAPQPLALDEQAPLAASTTGLCGLTASDVADIVDYYNLDPNMQGVAAALATPFDCSAYGNLCNTLTAPQAHAYACGAWTDMLAQKTVAEVNINVRERLTDWAQPCTPNWNKCENICDPYAVDVCDAILVDGVCRTLAICEIFPMIDIPFFSFLTID